jgi:UDP-N-acetylglucosamine 2-epimerase (non-hydrolysing)
MREQGRLHPTIVASGQHPATFHQALSTFDMLPDVSMRLRRMRGNQAELVSTLLAELDDIFAKHRPDAVLVQGDTSTTLAATLAAFWQQIPVVHLEAGLRSGDLSAPFPEEANRKLVSQISSLHLAPTPAAAGNLAEDGISGPEVLTIGNTIVDAALTLSDIAGDYADQRLAAVEERVSARGRRLVLVTAHRRESWGAPLRRVLAAVADLTRLLPDIEIVLPAHPNPLVAKDVNRILGRTARVTVTEPLPYLDLLRLMSRSDLVLSDSGGIQEEVASFGVPVMVLREVTERMEAVEAGFAELVGTDHQLIVSTATRFLDGTRPVPAGGNPFGDGRARYRAEQAIAWHLGIEAEPPAPFVPAQPSARVATVAS